jgi:hypothetical protein
MILEVLEVTTVFISYFFFKVFFLTSSSMFDWCPVSGDMVKYR